MEQRKNSRISFAVLIGFLALGCGLLWNYVAREAEEDNSFRAENYFALIRETGGIREYLLKSNGLHVLLAEDDSAPVVTTMVSYQAGSKYETGPAAEPCFFKNLIRGLLGCRSERESEYPVGLTHLLEHMVMKATKKYNAGTRTVAEVLQGVGAFMNATTYEDQTAYFETVPNDQLALALDVERERMRNVLFSDDDVKRESHVIRNELESLAQDPFAVFEERLWEAAFEKHPYRYSAIKERSSVERITPARLRQFYDLFYRPERAVLVVVGDFKTRDALRLIEEAFGEIQKAPVPPRTPEIAEPEQTAPRHFTLTTNETAETVVVAHQSPPAMARDLPALEVLSYILSRGAENRFKRTLITDSAIATSASSLVSKLQDPGLFISTVQLVPGVCHASAESAVLRIYDDLKANGVAPEELERAKKKLKLEYIFSRDGTFSVASQLAAAAGAGDWTLFPNYVNRIEAVTVDDVRRAARQYLVPGKMTVGYLISKQAPKPCRPVEASILPPKKAAMPSLEFSPGKENNRARIWERAKKTTARWLSPRRGFFRRAEVESIGGVKVISIKTNMKDVVMVEGSFEGAGSFFSENPVLAELVNGMLGSRTEKYGKDELAQLLERSGISAGFQSGKKRAGFHVRSLKKDFPLAMELTAEMLAHAVFDEDQFERAKQSRMVALEQEAQDPLEAGYREFKRLIYKPEDLNFEVSFEEERKRLEATMLQDVRDFYASRYCPGALQNFVMVAAGDVDSFELAWAVRAHFAPLAGEGASFHYPEMVSKEPPAFCTVPISGKKGLEAFFGHRVPLSRGSEDYLPAYAGDYVLGGDFSARLMKRLREELGLTYRVHSQFAGMSEGAKGHWVIHLLASPGKLEPAMDEIKSEVERFVAGGISEEEFERKRRALEGLLKVNLAMTQSLANTALQDEEAGLGFDYSDQIPERLRALSCEDVNRAIKAYFHPDQMSFTAAGDGVENFRRRFSW